MKVGCNYCGGQAQLVTGAVVYPRRADLHGLYFWRCEPCDAFVGTHKNSKDHAPLGRLADKTLRHWKKLTHAAFDPLWKSGQMTRHEAYAWASQVLGIPMKRTHIGMFDIEQCKALIEALALRSDIPPSMPKAQPEETYDDAPF